jgi:DNA-binding transcriptional LysR family regulator
MLETGDLRYFVEVVDSGGFGRAATRLGVSKSIVSRRIARMEAELGARLLTRTTRGIAPTEAGLDLRARGERILAELDEAREAMAEQSGDVVGRLRVTVPLAFGRRHIAPLLAELAARHPRLEIDVDFTDRVVDLVGERFDAAIRIGILRDSSLVARRIGAVRHVVVASPAYLERHGRPRTPAELAGHDCIIYSGAPSGEWRFRSGKRAVPVRPTGRTHTNDGEVMVAWAIAGLGVAQLPSFLVAEAIEAGDLEPILLDYSAEEGGIYAVRPPGRHTPGKVRVLFDALVERFGGEPFWDRCLAKGGTGDGKR